MCCLQDIEQVATFDVENDVLKPDPARILGFPADQAKLLRLRARRQ